MSERMKWLTYEIIKQKLSRQGLGPKAYEAALRKEVKRLKL